MFYVFGVHGRTYQGGVEHLQSVVPVGRAARVRRVEPSEINVPLYSETGIGGLSNAIAHEAVHAYTQTAQEPARQRLMRVADVMSHDVVTLAQHLSAADAWQTLAQHRISQAPVVDDTGQLVGLLMRADMLPAELLPAPEETAASLQPGITAAVQQTLPAQPVSALMWTPVPSVEPDTNLRHAARVMLELNLPGLAVTDDAGKIAGFISRSDILRAVVAEPPLDLWS